MNKILRAALLAGLASAVVPAASAVAGSLEFFANGEELATEGFVAPELTKDGWAIAFDHIFVTLADVTAYQAEPPYDAHAGGEVEGAVRAAAPEARTVDLVADAGEDSRLLVATVKAAPGHYNAISWRVARAQAGPAEGFSMVFVGTAEKDGRSVPFRLETDEESTYRCGDYVGDERKGFVREGGTADLEMTFHLDHVFGRADKDADDPMNVAAPGFAPFADGEGSHRLELRGLHVGHAGEAHCNVEWH